MAPKKPEKTVAGMAVLNDIRGLLSSTREPASAAPPPTPNPSPDLESGVARLKEDLKRLQDQLLSQQTVIDGLQSDKKKLEAALSNLESEKKELQAKLVAFQSQPLPPPSPPVPNPPARKETRRLEELVRTHQATISGLETEKKELQAKLVALQSQPKPPASLSGADRVARDVSDLEAQKAQLEVALSQIEDLLQIKVKDLARRIAIVYEEAGASGANRDFRRITNQLEAAQNFGEFLRSLTRE